MNTEPSVLQTHESWWLHASENPSSILWWLHASENPSSILCVVSGHLCAFLSIKTYFQALFILLCQ